ncbi:MAG TPA: hypothetical protein VGO93_14385 [Candidatus Xenobia bacterium]
MPVVFNMQVVLGLALPFCCAWDSQLLESVKKGRFMEATLLTGMTVEEWSDGMLRLSYRGAAPLLLFNWVLGLVTTLAYAWAGSDLYGLHLPEALGEAVLWLPAATLLVVSMSYFHQVRAVFGADPPDQEILQALVSLPLVGIAACIGWAWLCMEPVAAAAVLAACALALLLVRQGILGRLRRMLEGSTGPKTVWAPATKPWSKNPIIVRESFRAARRPGGTLGFYLLRYGPLATIMVWIVWMGCAQESRLYAVGLLWWTLGGALVAYGSALPAVFGERSRGAWPLLLTTPTTAREFASGWLEWATRTRQWELTALSTAAAICIWEWWYACNPVYRADATDWLGMVWLVAVPRFVLLALFNVGIWCSVRCHKWLAMHLWLLVWMVPLGLIPWLILNWLHFAPYEFQFARFAASMGFVALFAGLTRVAALHALSGGQGPDAPLAAEG